MVGSLSDTFGQRHRAGREHADVCAISAVGRRRFNVIAQRGRGDNALANCLNAHCPTRVGEDLHRLVGIEPGVAVEKEAITNARAETFEVRRMDLSRHLLDDDAEVVRHGIELFNESSIARVESDEQRPGLNDVERLAGDLVEFAREIVPRRHGPTLSLVVTSFTRTMLHPLEQACRQPPTSHQSRARDRTGSRAIPHERAETRSSCQ